MTTPIADFVKKYALSDISRFHMPGHKGHSFLGCEAFDITEISGADVLGDASGIIAMSEANATSLFGTYHSFYSTEGSSLCIKAMLALIKKRTKGAKVKILAARNAHKAFIYACALLDIDAKWIYPNDISHLCSCNISAKQLDEELKLMAEPPAAVYITSPDYLGNVADVKGLSEVCHKHGVPLLVDNAHGAYLAFKAPSEHPIALGADMCCDSAHKTLPVLTGGAYLHVSKNYSIFSESEIRNALSLFASTSPSYLILQSLDLCNAYLADGYREKLGDFIAKIKALRNQLSDIGFAPLSDTEDLKLVFSQNLCGYTGTELSQHLSKNRIEAEYADKDILVLMLTPELEEKDFDRLLNAFSQLPSKKGTERSSLPQLKRSERALSIREAILSDSETILSREAQGRICACPSVSCPPAIPIVVSGEVIDENTVALLDYYGVEKIDVIK